VTITAADLLPRCRFPARGKPVTCAVSGGADSTALLVLAVEAGLEVTAMHVEHGLRPGADEAEIVRANAAALGAGFRSATTVIEPGPNLEARAREQRHRILPAGALLGHTADDQAETLLLNLLRGTGVHGLGAMRTDDGRRPLLAIRRAETKALCDTLDLAVVQDPSNDDLSIRRNRVRHELVPLLDEIAERDVVPLLCRLSDVARSAGDHLDAEAETLEVQDARALREAPQVIAHLAVRLWLRSCDDHFHPPDHATIERVLAVARNELGATDVGAGWRVGRSAGRLRLEHRGTPR